MRLILILGIFFTFPSWVYSQSEIKGKVVDELGQTELEFASVALYQSMDSSLVEGSITDVFGRFLIKNVAQGSYFLKISFIGYRTFNSPPFNFTKNEKRDFGTFALKPDQQQLEGVEIQGQKITSDFRLDKQSYSAENFEVAQGGVLQIFSKIYLELVSMAKGNFQSEDRRDLWSCLMGNPFRVIQ